MSDGFLSRWSRRKRGDELPEPAPVASPDLAEPEAAGAEAEAGDAADALSPEELAELPSLDALTAETDVTAFLRRGVPSALRNAALRRAWAIDPQVRDFVCEAREYAYDWNVPGGVPGNGDLLPTDDVAGMLRRIFNDEPDPVAAPDPSSEVAGAAAEGSDLCDSVSQSSDDRLVEPSGEGDGIAGVEVDAAQHGSAVPASAVVEENASSEEGTPDSLPPASSARLAAPQPDRTLMAAMPALKRRHGRAAPI